jgi:hypothetical protein
MRALLQQRVQLVAKESSLAEKLPPGNEEVGRYRRPMLAPQNVPAKDLLQPARAIDLRNERRRCADPPDEFSEAVLHRANEERVGENPRSLADRKPRQRILTECSPVSKLAKEESLRRLAFH